MNITYENNSSISHDEGVSVLLIVAGATQVILSLLTIFGNALVLHAIRTDKTLQTVSNLYIMSLAIADLTVGLIVMPISAIYSISGKWKWGVIVCQAWLSVDYTASTASIFNLVILSLDRYWSVSNPLKYLSKRTSRRALTLIGSTWLAAATWLLPVLAWHHIFYEGQRQHEEYVCETEFSESIIFKVVTSALNFYGPSTLMVYLYYRIYQTIKLRSIESLGQVISHCDRSKYSPSPCVRKKEVFKNLTVLALQEVEKEKYNPSFYKGIVVEVEYMPNKTCEFESKNSNVFGSHLQIPSNKDICQDDERSKFANKQSISKDSRVVYKTTADNLERLPSSSNLKSSLRTNDSVTIRENKGSNDNRKKFRFSRFKNILAERRTISLTQSNSSFGNERTAESLNIVKERKAARQLGFIMGAFFACWIPYFTLFPIIAFCRECIPERLHMAVTWLGYLNSTLNPIIYPLCNHNFRRAFTRMLKCEKVDVRTYSVPRFRGNE